MSPFDFRPLVAAVALPLGAVVVMLALGNRRRNSADIGYAILSVAWTLNLAVDLVSWGQTSEAVLRRVSAATVCGSFVALMWFSTLADPLGARHRWRAATLALIAASLASTAWRFVDGREHVTQAWALLHSIGALGVYGRCLLQLRKAWVMRPWAWFALGWCGAMLLIYESWLPPALSLDTVLLDAAYLAAVVCSWIVAQRHSLRVGTGGSGSAGSVVPSVLRLPTLQERPRRASAGELQRVVDAERQRIARELHDSLGSHLVGLIALQDSTQPAQRATVAALEECLLELRIVVDTFHDDGASLVLSLARLRYRIQPSLDQLGIRMQWNVEDADAWAALPSFHARELLRIAQEALTNVMRHSGARRVAVTLCRRQRETVMVLEVRDDGCGFAEDKANGKGLSNMHRRAQAIGAQLELVGEPSYGTRVWVGYPLPAAGPGCAEPPIVASAID